MMKPISFKKLKIGDLFLAVSYRDHEPFVDSGLYLALGNPIKHDFSKRKNTFVSNPKKGSEFLLDVLFVKIDHVMYEAQFTRQDTHYFKIN